MPGTASEFVPPPVQRHRLDNGLEVFLLPDERAAVFTAQVWFRVGSAHEREGQQGQPGITGLSHFFEHLMFRGTAAFPDFFGAVYARGGRVNAWTWYDATCYWQKLPAGNLAFALQVESDRLVNLRLADSVGFEQEREVVRNERLLRTVNSPSGAVDERLHSLAFRASPYRWPVIGHANDLIALTQQQASEYFAAHYNPANAFIVVVGAFAPEEALAQIEEAYGALPAAPVPVRPPHQEPEPVAERRDYVERTTSAGLVQLAYAAPAASERDFLVLQVLNGILSRGKSARLQRALVYGPDPVATRLSASMPMMRAPYLYSMEMELVPGRANREAERRLDAVLDEVCRAPVTPAELAKAVNGMRGDAVRAALDTQGRADLVGFSVLATDDPSTLFRRLDEAGGVTADETLQVARRYLRPSRRAVVACVSPRRLELLRGEWAAAHGTGDAEAARACFEWADRRHGADERARALAEERQAVELLEARIEQELGRLTATGSPEAGEQHAALCSFRDEGGKGVVARRAARAEAEAELATLTATLDQERVELLTERARKPVAASLEPLCRAALGDGALPSPEAVSATGPATWSAPLLLELGRLAHRRGLLPEADAAARQVLALEASSEGPDPLLRTCAELAWECRSH